MNANRTESAIRFLILLLIMFLTPLFYVEPRIFGLSMPDAFNFPKRYLVASFSLALFLLFSLELVRNGSLRIEGKRILLPLSLFIAWSSASLLYCPSLHAGVRQVTMWICYGLIFLSAATDCRSDARARGLIAASAVSASLASMVAILQFSGHDFSAYRGGIHKVYATLGNPNYLASYLAVVLPAGFFGWLWIRAGWRESAAWLCFCLLGAAALMVSGGRGGMLALIAGIVISLFIWRAFLSPRRALVLFLVLATLTVFLLLPSPLNRYETAPLRRISELAGPPRASAAWRVMVWKISLEMLHERPLLGWGAGSFSLLYLPRAAILLSRPENARYHVFAEGGIDHVHNEYLEIVGELGLTGLALFSWFLILALGSGLPHHGERDKAGWPRAAISAGIIACSIEGLFGYPFHLWPSAGAFFAFSGILAGSRGAGWMIRAERSSMKCAIAVVAAAIAILSLRSMASSVISELDASRGIEAFRSGRREEAAVHLVRAAGRQPHNGRARFFLGLCLSEQGKYEEALAQTQAALATYPRQAAYVQIGRVLAKCGRRQAAASILDAAIRMVPRDPDAWMEKGVLLFGSDPAGAADCFRRVVSLRPDSTVAARNLAVALQAAGKDDEALEAYERAAALSPGDADLYLNMGAIWAGKNDKARARAMWEKALSLDPDNRNARENLRRLLL